jgi:pyrimidine operon attenuation protein/uracil phosphoribosyltransferase
MFGYPSSIIREMGTVLLDAADMRRTLGRMAHEILEANQGVEDLAVIGIMRRGWPIAKRLAFMMTQIEGTTVPCGRLDISAFRDDRPPSLQDETEIPFQIEGKKLIMVDEVIYTGRTIRAAMDALMQFGRPASIQLAVLVDRGFRELPIQPNYCGKPVSTEKGDHVIVKVNEYDGEDVVVLTTAKEEATPSGT